MNVLLSAPIIRLLFCISYRVFPGIAFSGTKQILKLFLISGLNFITRDLNFAVVPIGTVDSIIIVSYLFKTLQICLIPFIKKE